jgi:hydrophobic/amphiphilic exporter-1 (mainly G- bacteria), HAE1 family
MFVDFFIKRPVFATVCALLTVIGGAVALPTLPIAQYPQLTAPQVQVISVYTGASADTVESAVTTPLEQAINGVEGMLYLQSNSSNDGTSTITVTFEVSRNVDLAAVDVQNRVNQVVARLPTEVKNNGVTVQKTTTSIVLGAAVYAEHGEYSTAFISNYLDLFIRDAVKRVKGVADVRIFGERKYAMRLWLDPTKLAARKLTASDVVRALREQNVQVAAGEVGREPALPGQPVQISVRAEGRLSDPAQFGRVILKSDPDGTLVLLKDIGRAEVGAEDYTLSLRYNAHEAVGIGVFQLATANALDVERESRETLLRLAKTLPPGLKLEIAFDPTTAVRDSIREVLTTLIEAIALVILVIFLFLQGWRATLIPAITIPVSLVGTLIFIKVFGFSINTLTLFGLTLATGLVVDDAIVVIENIERHVEEHHQSPRLASSRAMGEVAGAVIATSLVLIAVFVPVALFPGTTGRIYQQFALTIAFSVALSAFNALTLTPALSALLVRHDPRPKRLFFRSINRGLAWFTDNYKRGLGSVIRNPLIAILFVAALAATFWVYGRVPTGFVPDEDSGYFIIAVQGPPGSSLQKTVAVTKQVEQILGQAPEVEGIFNVNGFSFTGSGGNKAIMFVALKPLGERSGKEHASPAVLARLRGRLFGLQDAFVVPFLPPSIQGVGAFGGFQMEIEDRTGGPVAGLAGATFGMMGAAAQRKDVTGVFSAFTADDPQLVLSIDRDRAKALGVPFDDIGTALQVYMGSQYVNDFDFNQRSYRVIAQADSEFRAQPRDLRGFYVRAASGEMIPLEAVTRVETRTAPQTISHFNMFRSAELNGSAAPGVSSGEALGTMEQLAGKVLPPGMAFEWAGLSLEQQQSGQQALYMFFLGILIVYLVLAALYESFALPFIILLAVPVAILGALLLMLLRGLVNDVFCQIGMVMLVGLASKNAILIVEFAEQLRHKGMTISAAAIEAARIRLRPILMTSFAFILGVLPLVFAAGAGQNSRRSLGTAVFGGMIASTFLNLFFIPVLYVLVETWRERRKPVPAPEPEPGRGGTPPEDLAHA